MPSMPLAELLAPNLHVALVHFPLGLLVVGVAVELISSLWPESSARAAGRWMIGLGVLSAVPAAFSGIYALRAVARLDPGVDRTWADVRAASPVLSDPLIWKQLRTHAIYQSVATGVAVLAAVAWLGCSDDGRRAVRVPVLAVLVVCVGGMMVGAWFSGEAIYKHGTGVDRGWPADSPTAAPTAAPTRVEDLFPPVELHVVLAGTTVALAAAAVGLSFRKLTVAAGPPVLSVHEHGSADLVRSFNPNIEVGAYVPKLPAARFWLLAFVVAATTSLGGWFVLARSADVFEDAQGKYGQVPQLLWRLVKPDPAEHERVTRLLVHLIAGGTIIGLPLLLAALARFAPRQRVALAAATLVLAGAVAAQVWFGVLLMYDTPRGPINHFNPGAAETAPPAAAVTSASPAAG